MLINNKGNGFILSFLGSDQVKEMSTRLGTYDSLSCSVLIT